MMELMTEHFLAPRYMSFTLFVYRALDPYHCFFLTRPVTTIAT